jgi:ABC-type molybdate transport system ATPase subunit
MSEANRIRAEFHNVLGNFTLDAAFEVPARGVTALFGPSGCGKTIVAFNTFEGWSQDASTDITQELRRRCDLQMRDVPSSLEDFV